MNNVNEVNAVGQLINAFGIPATIDLLLYSLGQYVAGKRGRGTLEERPYHIARQGLTMVAKSFPPATTNMKEEADPQLKRHVASLVETHQPLGLINMFFESINEGELPTTRKRLHTISLDINAALAHLAARRARFRPSAKAFVLGLASYPLPGTVTPDVEAPVTTSENNNS